MYQAKNPSSSIDYDHAHELEMAQLTAENHGDAYRLLSQPNFCRLELVKVIRRHHSDLSEMEAEVVAQKVLVQWQADRSESAVDWVRSNPSALVDQLSQLAFENGLVATHAEILADGTIDLRFGEVAVSFDRYISATIDPEGASVDVGGFIDDYRSDIQIDDVPLNKPLPRHFRIAVDGILKA
jgi:hypothetical protein